MLRTVEAGRGRAPVSGGPSTGCTAGLGKVTMQRSEESRLAFDATVIQLDLAGEETKGSRQSSVFELGLSWRKQILYQVAGGKLSTSYRKLENVSVAMRSRSKSIVSLILPHRRSDRSMCIPSNTSATAIFREVPESGTVLLTWWYSSTLPRLYLIPVPAGIRHRTKWWWRTG